MRNSRKDAEGNPVPEMDLPPKIKIKKKKMLSYGVTHYQVTKRGIATIKVKEWKNCLVK